MIKSGDIYLDKYSGWYSVSDEAFYDEDEIENYTNKNVYGAEGGHYKNEPAFSNPNRTKMTKF